MARIPLIDPAACTEAERHAYARFPSNLVRGLLCTTPEITNGYLSLGKALAESPLSAKLREMTILRISKLSHSAYERMQHVGIAKSSGVTDEELVAVESGDYQRLTHQEAAMLNFVDEAWQSPRPLTPLTRLWMRWGHRGWLQ